MSKSRPGINSNSDFSALNQADSKINSDKLFDGCKVIFYTSTDSSSLRCLALNTSDNDEPRLIKQELKEDKQDNYIFKLVSSNGGYLIQAVNNTKLYLIPSSNGKIYGSTAKSGVWKFANVGGKKSLTCKILASTISKKDMFISEKDGEIMISDKGDSEYTLGITFFGKNAFEASVSTNPYLQKLCCDDKADSSVKSICKDKKFTPGASSCPGNFAFMAMDKSTPNFTPSKVTLSKVAKDNYNTLLLAMIILIILLMSCAYYCK